MNDIRKDSEVKKIAKEHGMDLRTDFVKAIIAKSISKVQEIVKEYGVVETQQLLLDLIAAKIGVLFEVVLCDFDVEKLKKKYLSKNELCFAQLEDLLDTNTDAVLIHRMNASPGDRHYIAVIDGRGEKFNKIYFSKWHEIAHVLISPPQLHMPLHRTEAVKKEPLEKLVDMVANKISYYEPIVKQKQFNLDGATGPITFQMLLDEKRMISNEGSVLWYFINRTKTIKKPMLFLTVNMDNKKEDYVQLGKTGTLPPKKLRAKHITANSSSIEIGISIHPNMEVPKESSIYLVWNRVEDESNNVENLSIWKHSNGTTMNNINTNVAAKRFGEHVYVLIQPC